MNRSATASLHSATPKKNVPCFLDLAVVKFFLKKERTFFFGVLPSRSRAGGGTMRTKFCKNYFLGKGFCKTSAHLFLNLDVANGKGGVWGGIFHLLLFLFWRNSGRTARLGKNLKRIRTEKGLTQGDIVRSLGFSRSFVSNIENGKTNPTLSTITNLAKALGVSTDELLK
jgi:DNA-binding XRE family transcriptional regulator